MRTTISIHDALYHEVRQIAAARGSTVGSVVEEAVALLLTRHHLARQAGTADVVDLPVFSGGGVQPGVDLDSNASLRDVLDEGVPLHALR